MTVPGVGTEPRSSLNVNSAGQQGFAIEPVAIRAVLARLSSFSKLFGRSKEFLAGVPQLSAFGDRRLAHPCRVPMSRSTHPLFTALASLVAKLTHTKCFGYGLCWQAPDVSFLGSCLCFVILWGWKATPESFCRSGPARGLQGRCDASERPRGAHEVRNDNSPCQRRGCLDALSFV